MATVESAGSYCANITEEVIHYTKQDAWTPNNIKRLIVSPDGVVVQLHTSSTLQKKIFDARKYASCIVDSKYKKMVSALGGGSNNVCSHVEEIIYCLKGRNGAVLHNEEANLSSIVSSTKATQTEEQLKKAIGDRYKRLYAIIYYSDSIDVLLKNYSSKMLQDATYHIAENTGSDGAIKAVFIHKSDWWKGTYFRPAHYKADSPDGLLARTINKVGEKMDNAIKAKEIEKVKSERMSGFENTIKTEMTRLKIYLVGLHLIQKMYNSNNESYFYNEFGLSEKIKALANEYKSPSKATINDVCDYFKKADENENKIANSLFTITSADKIEAKQDKKALADTEIKMIKVTALKSYIRFSDFCLSLFTEFASKYKTTFKYTIKQCNNAIAFMDSSGNIHLDALQSIDSSLILEKASMKTSMRNMCVILATLFISDKSTHTVEYWNNIIAKVGA